jgi:SAM-dependent methyltransferase
MQAGLTAFQRARAILGLRPGVPFAWARRLNDADWFNVNAAPAEYFSAPAWLRPGLLNLPTAEEQDRFTGCSGTRNIREAFRFYQYCRAATSEARPIAPTDAILDFGCGWGRISRLWLRDVEPSRIWCIDCFSYAIELIRSTRIPVNILHTNPFPPAVGLPGGFRLIYAFSVFSHLSEDAALKWISFFADQLQPGGHLIFTTMGRDFIATLQHLRHNPPEGIALQRTIAYAPSQEKLEADYAAGKFVFYGSEGGGELTEDFYGWSMIPDAWLRGLKVPGLRFCSARADVDGLNQTVVVMQKDG